MKNNKRIHLRVLAVLASVILWFLIWDLTARSIDNSAFFVGVKDTFFALGDLIKTEHFWLVIWGSMKRIVLGFALGVFIGAALAVISHHVYPVKVFVSLGMGVIKSTPVASVIMLIWIFLKSASVPTAIAVLMVAPIIWQNLTDGYDSIDNGLSEVANVFEFSPAKRFKYLTFPALLKFFVPAVLTSISLAWKAGIAAEIIAGTRDSIGRFIKDSKASFDSDEMLAWTVSIIVISIIFETLIKLLIRRYRSRGT